jgi:heat shock protein HslJ
MIKKSRFHQLVLAPALLALVACGPQAGSESPEPDAGSQAAPPPATEPAAAAVPTAAAPSWQEAANAAYAGVFDEPVVLTDGQWEGEPYVEGGASAPRAGLADGFLLAGDLDGDDADESVVLVWSSTGGSGTFDFVAVLDRDANGAVVNRATAPLGDRVQVRSAAIEDGRVVLETVQAGPEDAACCPGQKMRRTFVLEGDAMTETASEDQGRMSLADLAGEWKLLRFGAHETAPEDVEITLQFADGTISGQAACNRYSGGVKLDDAPGGLSLSGPMAVTRMMCPPPLMDWEQRYLQALESLVQYSFTAGKLALTWRGENDMGTLWFGRAETGESADSAGE